MGWKSVAVAGLAVAAVLYVVFYQGSLFTAITGSTHSGNSTENVTVKPFLPASPSPSWSVSGLTYSCGGAGPGTLQITNGGSANVTVTSVSLYYRGTTYVASGPMCMVAPGTATISITGLGAPAGTQFSTYGGYVNTSDGREWSFNGFWQ